MLKLETIKRAAVRMALVGVLAGLAACGAAPGSGPLVWKSRQLAFVVDQERGVLQMLSVRSGVSLLKSVQLGNVTSEPVILLDEQRGQLWVRGDDELVRFDLPSLQPTGTWSLPTSARGATLAASPNGAITLYAAGKAFVIDSRIVAELGQMPAS